MTLNVPASFLPAQAPADAVSRRIDFAQSNPPLPEYRNLFAAVIDNALTEAECKELIRQAESTTLTTDSSSHPTWERATINGGGGRQILATGERNCGRIIYDSQDVADKLHARLMPFLQDFGIDRLDNQPSVTGLAGRNKAYRLTRLNERLRFLRYESGGYFTPHCDAIYTTPDRKEKSFYTIHLYLNGEGDQDLEELRREEARVDRTVEDANVPVNHGIEGTILGGATSFLPRFEEKERQLRVFPKTGSVLVFQQNNLLHGGDPVFRGTKYTLRTDIMYQQL